MSLDRTLRGLIASGRDEAVAIAAHDAPPLGYARAARARSIARPSLNELGIGRGDRVAIVLPNGPEMATAFFAWRPPRPRRRSIRPTRQDEFEFYLEDLKAKALIVEAGSDVAGARGGARSSASS